MIVYELGYDRDWGQRHPRRPELTWLFDKRLTPEQTIRFLKSEGYYNTKAYIWRREPLRLKNELIKLFKEQDKDVTRISKVSIYGSTSRSGPILR